MSDDAQAEGRRVVFLGGRDGSDVAAAVSTDRPAADLARIEADWSLDRSQLSAEHAHWDWLGKALSVAARVRVLTTIESAGQVQGAMATYRLPRPSPVDGRAVLYVDYLEAAPWNLASAAGGPRLIGVGTALLVEAVRASLAAGCAGRVGLHSLKQASRFYARRGMTSFGPDPAYLPLEYFEYNEEGGAALLAQSEERA